MSEYVFVDGPLAGQVLGSGELHVVGEALVIEVVDVAQMPDQIPRFDYVVESAPWENQPGRLRHAA